MKIILLILGFVATAYLLVGVYLFLNQRNFIYFPVSRPHAEKLDGISISTSRGQVHALTANPGSENAILYFGGNAEDVAYNIAIFQAGLPGHSIYLLDYPGYGYSGGSPTEEAIYEAAAALFDQIEKQHNEISVIGRSLGSGVATFLASERALDRLILVTPFDSIARIAQNHYPVFPVSMLLKDQFDSGGRAHLIDAPTLLIIAEHDEIIPASSSISLAGAFSETTPQIKTVGGAGHNDLQNHPSYINAISSFLSATLP